MLELILPLWVRIEILADKHIGQYWVGMNKRKAGSAAYTGLGTLSGNLAAEVVNWEARVAVDMASSPQRTKLFCERWAVTSKIFWLKWYFKHEVY